MSDDPRLEDRLARLGREQAHDALVQARKQRTKARLFGDPPPPRRIGRFLDLGLLGRGAMGTVRRAYDERLAREVAIKLVSDPAARHHHDRLLREARALAKLSHPNVVQIYETGELDGEVFIAMELVDGTPLDAWQRERHPWRECLEVYLQAGRGLAAAHEAGLVHRDFKPANCIRDLRGRVRVLDFGLARVLDLDAPFDTPSPASTNSAVAPLETSSTTSASTSLTMLQTRLTATHTVMGTLAYMAPEQLAGRTADARSDQFSFCVALFEALLGERPFGESPGSALLQMLHGTSPSMPALPTASGVPTAVHDALRRGLSTDPAARWPAMDALLRRLEGALRPPRWRLPLRLGLLTASTALPIATVMGGDDDPCSDATTDLSLQWGDERHREVREALLATDVPYSSDTWKTVERELDDYALALEREQLTTCRAARRSAVDPASSYASELLCLERRRGAFEHAVALLGTADRALVEHAGSLVLGLPSVEECLVLDDPRSLGTNPGPQAQEIAMILDRARNLIATGRYDQGFDAASQAATEAKTLDDPLLRAEALLVEGRARMGAGRAKEARAMLEAASTAALRHGSDELVVAANANLVEVVGVALAEQDRGLILAEWTVSLAERPSVRQRTQAVAHTVHGHLSTTRGELGPAERHYERALELLLREYGDDHLALVEPLDGLATVLRQRGELRLALEHRRRALALLLGTYGEQHPSTAFTRANLAAILRDQGELAEARQQLEQAIAVLTRALGADHPALAAPRSGLATLLDEQGEHAEADPEHREAIRIWVQALGPDHPDAATARYNLAASLGSRGQRDAAIVELERALGILRGRPSTR
ncbi:MAG: serine/threonine protein kinase, partial [Myxococcales bacterium]|nr:serine/threonine protein kinase [Myxococcales bacterium]